MFDWTHRPPKQTSKSQKSKQKLKKFRAIKKAPMKVALARTKAPAPNKSLRLRTSQTVKLRARMRRKRKKTKMNQQNRSPKLILTHTIALKES